MLFLVILLGVLNGGLLSVVTKNPKQPTLSLNDYFQVKVGYNGEENTKNFLQSKAFQDSEKEEVTDYLTQSDYNGAVQITEYTSTSVKGTIYTNQSASIALETMAAKSFEATIQHLSQKPAISLSFESEPLPSRQILLQASISNLTMIFVYASIFCSFLESLPRIFLFALLKEHQSGVSKQLLMAGVKFKHQYVADWFTEFINLAAYSGIFLLFSSFVIKQDLSGVWLPWLLYCIVQPLWTKMLFQFVKEASLSYVGVLHPVMIYIPVAIGSLCIAILDIKNG